MTSIKRKVAVNIENEMSVDLTIISDLQLSEHTALIDQLIFLQH